MVLEMQFAPRNTFQTLEKLFDRYRTDSEKPSASLNLGGEIGAEIYRFDGFVSGGLSFPEAMSVIISDKCEGSLRLSGFAVTVDEQIIRAWENNHNVPVLVDLAEKVKISSLLARTWHAVINHERWQRGIGYRNIGL